MRKSTLASSLGLLLCFLALAPAAHAGVTVRVSVRGTVVGNQIGSPPLGNVNVGDPALLVCEVDSSVFTNSPSFPTRGYEIDEDSFALTMGATTIGLQNPFPAGMTPYFVLRDNDPAVDGFFLSRSVDNPLGVPIDQTGGFGQFVSSFSVTYGGTKLASLDILGALGTYNFAGLSVFNFTVDDGPFNPLIIDFISMTIEVVPSFVNYCTAGTSASGCQAVLSATGTPSASAPSGFDLLATGVEGSKDALFFFAANGRQANSWGNGTSLQCVMPPVFRGGLLNGVGTPGACDGSFSQDLNARWVAKPFQNPGAGAVVQAQLWYRDPQNTSNQTTSLSEGLEFTVQP